MSKPLVVIKTDKHRFAVYQDGSYEGSERIKSIEINLPAPIQHSEEVKAAAREANKKHSQWNERWHKAR